MGFILTNRLDQAIRYELEHVVESAVRAAMPVAADDVLRSTRRACVGPYGCRS
jgi:hypothetical protein